MSVQALHGITLESILTRLVDHYGWEQLGQRIEINCFISEPSIKSSLKFLRKTPWARKKVEDLYLETQFPTKARIAMLNENATTLKEHLKSLHADLERTGEVDAELQELLRQLDGDIHTLLEKRSVEEEGESTTYGLAERSQEITARFAAQHPRLEPALRELGNILSSMGI